MARSQLQVDHEMLRRIAAGESAALGELYDRYGSQSYGLALRIVGNAGDAEAAEIRYASGDAAGARALLNRLPSRDITDVLIAEGVTRLEQSLRQ